MKIQTKESVFDLIRGNRESYGWIIDLAMLRDRAGLAGVPNTNMLTQLADTHEVTSSIPSDLRETEWLKDRLGDCITDWVWNNDAWEKFEPIFETMMPDDLFWIWREYHWFNTGKYQPPLFVEQFRSLDLQDRHLSLWWHMPHISLNEPTMVAYTPSVQYGKEDRQVVMKVGRYIQKFYGDLLAPEVIRSMADGVKKFDIHFGDTREYFRGVYEHDNLGSCGSCMTGSVSRFDVVGDYHPVEVYASGEFRIVWMTDPFSNNTPYVARAIVHEPSKSFVRVYGVEASALRDRLELMGYFMADSWPVGARLLEIKDDNDDDDSVYVLPYIDGSRKTVKLTDTGFVICDSSGDYDFYCSDTRGVYGRKSSTAYCEGCNTDVDVDDPDDLDWEYSDYYGHYLCHGCTNHGRYVVAVGRHGREDWVHGEHVIYVNDRAYHDSYLQENDIVYSDAADEYLHRDDAVDAEGDGVVPISDALMMADGEWRYVPSMQLFVETAFVFVRQTDGGFDCYEEGRENDDEILAQLRAEERTVVDDLGNLVMPDIFTAREVLERYAFSTRKIYAFMRRIGLSNLSNYDINLCIHGR